MYSELLWTEKIAHLVNCKNFKSYFVVEEIFGEFIFAIKATKKKLNFVESFDLNKPASSKFCRNYLVIKHAKVLCTIYITQNYLNE